MSELQPVIKVFRRELLEVGDILCYAGRGWLGLFAKGYEHVSVVSKINADGTIQQIQAHLSALDLKGVKKSGIMESWVDEKEMPKVRRFKGGLQDWEKIKVIEHARDAFIGKRSYGLSSFPLLWIWSSIFEPLKLGNLKPPSCIVPEEIKVCSTFLQDLFVEALNKDPLPDLNDECGVPGDYMEQSEVLFTVT